MSQYYQEVNSCLIFCLIIISQFPVKKSGQLQHSFEYTISIKVNLYLYCVLSENLFEVSWIWVQLINSLPDNGEFSYGGENSELVRGILSQLTWKASPGLWDLRWGEGHSDWGSYCSVMKFLFSGHWSASSQEFHGRCVAFQSENGVDGEAAHAVLTVAVISSADFVEPELSTFP